MRLAPLALLLAVTGCIVVPARPPPPPPPSRPAQLLTEQQAVDVAADYARSRGYQILRTTRAVLDARARWHIENTGFHQWTTHWKLAHVFRHHPQGLRSLFWLFFAAYNLLTLFQYLQLRSYGRDRGKDVTRTLSRLIDQMRDELACSQGLVWDTS